MVTVVAAADEATITFDTSHCTFQGLAAQADDGISSQVGLTTTGTTATTGSLYANGDFDRASDGTNTGFTVAGTKVITAKTW